MAKDNTTRKRMTDKNKRAVGWLVKKTPGEARRILLRVLKYMCHNSGDRVNIDVAEGGNGCGDFEHEGKICSCG